MGDRGVLPRPLLSLLPIPRKRGLGAVVFTSPLDLILSRVLLGRRLRRKSLPKASSYSNPSVSNHFWPIVVSIVV